MKQIVLIVFAGIIASGCSISSIQKTFVQDLDLKAEKVALCDLKKDPAAYNHKLIEVTGFVSHGFENFTVFDPICASYPEVWLEYGGTAASGTIYCCGVTAERNRPEQIAVEDIPIPLAEDQRFHDFDRLIQRQPDSVVHATLMGRFFSGELRHWPAGDYWGGYGHFGCCSLFVIQKVLSVDVQTNNDLDYRAYPDSPDISGVGCGFRDMTPISPYQDILQAQQEAESGKCEWCFTDPKRVAREALARYLKLDETSSMDIKKTRKSQGRLVYQWKPKEKETSYMIVVSRPYWLTYYAKDANKIAWVVIAAYESSCKKGNSVSRVQ